MARRIARVGLLVILVAAPLLAAQAPSPSLTLTQRNALAAVIAAVDAASKAPAVDDAAWQMHVLRASDGSHYVAFSAEPPGAPLPATPVILYVRLASRVSESTVTSERSAVMDWLNGLRRDPLPLRPTRVIAVATGEMPVGGTLAMSTRGGAVGQSSAALAMVGHEEERRKAQQAERERQRRAALEGTQAPASLSLYPFEDFDVAATPVRADRTSLLRRSLTAGPGDYVLSVGWIDPADRAASVRVLRRDITLGAAHASGLALSSIIVADAVGVRDTPYPPDQQTAHPYVIGATDITPAGDAVFTSAERLAIVFQVINAQPDPAGKPDVSIAFRLLRVTPSGEESMGVLNPQSHNAMTLPVDFDLAKGHPIFAAVAMPLSRFARGPYRLRITASDRLAGSSTTADAAFRIAATPAELLKAAPSLGASFARDSVLTPAVLDAALRALKPATPTPAMSALVDAAAARRFADALRDATVAPDEQASMAVVRAIALYALGDTPETIAVHLRQALARGAPAAPTHVFLGACGALVGNDRDAATSWTLAADAGLASPELRTLLVDAFLRQGEGTQAMTHIGEGTGGEGWSRVRVASLVAVGREADALTALDRRIASEPADVDAQWLRLHALFAQFVRGDGFGATPAGAVRFTESAAAYIGANAPHASLAGEWRDARSGAASTR